MTNSILGGIPEGILYLISFQKAQCIFLVYTLLQNPFHDKLSCLMWTNNLGREKKSSILDFSLLKTNGGIWDSKQNGNWFRSA